MEDGESAPAAYSPIKTSSKGNSQRQRRPRKPVSDFPLMKDESHNHRVGRRKFRRRNDTTWLSSPPTTTWRPIMSTSYSQPRGRGVDINSLAGGSEQFPGNDYDHLDSPTCGVARITDRNRNGIAMRILGGQETQQGRWPWQVAVLNKMNVIIHL